MLGSFQEPHLQRLVCGGELGTGSGMYRPSADVEPVELAGANQPFFDHRPRRVSSFIIRVMTLCNTACSASSVGARTSALRGAVCQRSVHRLRPDGTAV